MIRHYWTMRAVRIRHLLSWCRQGERGRRRSWRTARPPAWRPSSSLAWRRQMKAAAQTMFPFDPPLLFFCLFACLFFSLLHHCPQPRFHEVAWLLVPGCRADGPQVQQVVGAAPSSSSHSCYLSLLTLVYLCQLRVPLQISLFHVGFDR